jgi:hypothetical protein
MRMYVVKQFIKQQKAFLLFNLSIVIKNEFHIIYIRVQSCILHISQNFINDSSDGKFNEF